MGMTSRRLISGIALIFLSVGSAPAADNWAVTRLIDHVFPQNIVADTRGPAPNGLPDGLVATHSRAGDVSSAWYAGPTTRYGHAILGDSVEASVLRIKTSAGQIKSLTLPETEVFEDRTPQLADLDGDGSVEIVTIRSSVSLGAAVTVYGLRGDTLRQLATTDFIGLSNRWLNIAGIAGFRGGPGKEIAYVQTPHIGGTLFMYAFENGRLKIVGQLDGFSNHVIGSREMRLSALVDINGDGTPELALPSANRRRLRIVGYSDQRLNDRATVRLPARIDKAIAVLGSDLATRIVIGLENGTVYGVGR
jgi:hypothetical protein